MIDTIPSTAALRAFEAAANRLNFTAAARDLNLTQGAISHQIRDLEARLGTPLFARRGRGLALTQAGQSYLPFVREALERLRAGAEAIRPTSRPTVLTVSVSPNFATKWLVPRLGAFLADHPDLDLRISAAMAHVDFAGDGIDLAVRHGTGSWPELAVTKLCSEELFPVCSPALLANGPPLKSPADLARQVLIQDRSREGWGHWLQRAAPGLEGIDLDHGPVFNQTSLAIDAAVAAQGVALARSALAALDLAAGRLVRPLNEAVPAEFAYWIVCPKARAELPKIRRFTKWLLQTAEADQDRPSTSPMP
ncbi:MAG: transcriptional regulator GcvA [Pseudomonadota bacterium]